MNVPRDPRPLAELRERLGGIDLYLLDLLLHGGLDAATSVLDAGCGEGRNAVALARLGFAVTAVDIDGSRVEELSRRASNEPVGPGSLIAQCEDLERLSFANALFDAVVCNAVLHFARSTQQFEGWLDEMWRVLRPGGVLFARLSTTHGVEHCVAEIGDRRYRLPGGAQWWLADEPRLEAQVQRLGAQWVQGLKTVIVHGQRSMSNWVLRKPAQ